MTSPDYPPTPERSGSLPPPNMPPGSTWQHRTPDGGWSQPLTPLDKPKRKRRVFMWVFLAVQVLFLVWAITGAASANGQPTDCGSLSAEDCNAASDIGTGIGVAIIIGAWFFVDVFLGVGYAVYRLAKRPDR